jgi:hypothetical protein
LGTGSAGSTTPGFVPPVAGMAGSIALTFGFGVEDDGVPRELLLFDPIEPVPVEPKPGEIGVEVEELEIAFAPAAPGLVEFEDVAGAPVETEGPALLLPLAPLLEAAPEADEDAAEPPEGAPALLLPPDEPDCAAERVGARVVSESTIPKMAKRRFDFVVFMRMRFLNMAGGFHPVFVGCYGPI